MTAFSVRITAVDPQRKVTAIMKVRETTGVGIAEAKTMVENLPCTVLDRMHLVQARELVHMLEQNGMVANAVPDPAGAPRWHSLRVINFNRGAERWYLYLAVIGTALPFVPLVGWLADHGPDVPLLLAELSSRITAFFGLDVLVSAVVLLVFIRREASPPKMDMVWLPILATCVAGVSSGLPLFLYLRERSRIVLRDVVRVQQSDQPE